MCILFLATNPAPVLGKFRIIIASNRDEYYNRPSEPATYRKDLQIIGGRDLKPGFENGMWLGVSTKQNLQKFRFGALLNITGERNSSGLKPRGSIVYDYLEGDLTTSDYNRKKFGEEAYNPFNFVTIELNNETVKTNYFCNTPTCEKYFEGEQILAFGNTPDNKPLQKVVAGKKIFSEIIDKYNDINKKEKLVEGLINLLKTEEKFLPDLELETRSPQVFQDLSRIFVKMLDYGYGSRTHSIILVDYHWNVEFLEYTMKEPIDVTNPTWSEVHFKSVL